MASRIFYGLYHLLPFKRLLIIIINISQYRSDAIILQRCRRSCHCSPTEKLTNKSCSVVLLVCDSLRFTRQGFCETNFACIEKPLGLYRISSENSACCVRSAGQVANLVVSNLCIMWFTTTCCWDLFVKGPQTK